jgi:hypothetical protein
MKYIISLILFVLSYSLTFAQNTSGFSGIYSIPNKETKEVVVYSLLNGFANGTTIINYDNGIVKYYANYCYGFCHGPIYAFSKENKLLGTEYYLMGRKVTYEEYSKYINEFDIRYYAVPLKSNNFSYSEIGSINGEFAINEKGTGIIIYSEFENGLANGKFEIIFDKKVIIYGKVKNGEFIERYENKE